MPVFGARSKRHRATLHPYLQDVVNVGIRHFDFAIISGFRNEEQQNEAFHEGRSTKPWPESTHNHRDVEGRPCSLGVDIAPWFKEVPHIRWNKPGAFIYACARLIQIAESVNIPLRWGGDWDMDTELYDQNFNDWGHLELVGLS